jgi:hypothetical protein
MEKKEKNKNLSPPIRKDFVQFRAPSQSSAFWTKKIENVGLTIYRSILQTAN